MSEDGNRDDKTEAPTDKRRSEAQEKGNTPFSREAVSFASLAALIAGLSLFLPGLMTDTVSELRSLLAGAGQLTLDSGEDAGALAAGYGRALLTAFAPYLIVIAGGGVLGSILQNMPAARLERVKPQWRRLSPAANLSRILGKEGMIEFAKALAKCIALFAIAYVVLRGLLHEFIDIGLKEPGLIPEALAETAMRLLMPTAAFIFILAVIDLVWTRVKWWRDLMMSRQDLKDELRNTEGDPLFKQRRRQIAQKRLRRRMMADLPKATVVVVNPTHYAVALRYVQAEGGAPLVIAKGLDSLALKIREETERRQIPIVESKALARSLYSACEVGETIPAEFYRAVAEVILFVEQRRRLSRGPGKPGARTRV